MKNVSINDLFLSRRAILSALAISMLLSISGCGPAIPEIPESLKQYVKRSDKDQRPIAYHVTKSETPGFSINIGNEDFPNTKRILSELKTLDHVQQLELSYDQRLIEQIKGFEDLEVLHLGCAAKGGDKNGDFSWTGQLKNLKELSIAYHSWQRYKEAKLTCPPGLQYLSCYGLPIESLAQVIRDCKELEFLDASFNDELKDVSVISKLPLLKSFKINQKPLREACKDGLVFDLDKLEILKCRDDLQGLKGNAGTLTVFGFMGLKNLNGLENVKFSHLKLNSCNKLEDIDALAKSSTIAHLELHKCMLNGQPITEADLSAVKKANPNLEINIVDK